MLEEKSSGKICIFCKQEQDVVSSSKEHIIPESLGNKVLVLPKGMVCKGCNNNKLSHLDDALLNFPPIKTLRFLNKTKNKEDLVVSTIASGGTELRYEDDVIRVDIPNRKPKHSSDDLEAKKTFTINLTYPGFNADKRRKLARAIYKIIFEYIAHDKGVEYVLDEFFDGTRNFILGNEGFTNGGYLFIDNIVNHQECFEISYMVPGISCVRIHNLAFFLNIEDSPTDKSEIERVQHNSSLQVVKW